MILLAEAFTRVALVAVLVKENGIGFDVKKARMESSGLGMKSLAIRTDILNGSLSIDSTPGQGTNYFVKIPAG